MGSNCVKRECECVINSRQIGANSVLVAKTAESTLGSFKISRVSKSREEIFSLNTHEDIFKYCGLFWSLEHGKDLNKLE